MAMKRQTSVQLDDNTKRQLAWLTANGFGKQSAIIRTAIDRLFEAESMVIQVAGEPKPYPEGDILPEGHPTHYTAARFVRVPRKGP